MVLNYPAKPPGHTTGGPCYRCIFPKPPPPESVVSCGDGGILGPVVGVMGVLQALETIKLIVGPSAAPHPPKPFMPTLLIFSALSFPPFRSVRIRTRRNDCAVCSSKATVTSDTLNRDSYSYQKFCGLASPSNLLDPTERISAREYSKIRHGPHVVIDVRDPVQFDICHLPSSINIPLEELPRTLGSTSTEDIQDPSVTDTLLRKIPPDVPIHVVCRLGQDSQLAVRRLKQLGYAEQGRYVGDIKGGYRGWKQEVDPDWPEY